MTVEIAKKVGWDEEEKELQKVASEIIGNPRLKRSLLKKLYGATEGENGWDVPGVGKKLASIKDHDRNTWVRRCGENVYEVYDPIRNCWCSVDRNFVLAMMSEDKEEADKVSQIINFRKDYDEITPEEANPLSDID